MKSRGAECPDDVLATEGEGEGERRSKSDILMSITGTWADKLGELTAPCRRAAMWV